MSRRPVTESMRAKFRRARGFAAMVVFLLVLAGSPPLSAQVAGSNTSGKTLGVTGLEVPPSLLGWSTTPLQEETPAASGGELRTPETFGTSWRFVRTSGEIVGFNLAMTMFGRFLFTEGKEGFIVSTKSIHENLKAGMEWDDNTFGANNFRHPWQGGMYFNAARANHYDFYQSSAFSFLGAWLWEYTGENHHPSVNDWINTAVGGMAFGESLWRLSDMVLDNTATKGRVWHELGGFVLSPLRGVNRLITGEAFAVHANDPDKFPAAWDGLFRIGVRTLGSDQLWDESTSRMFIAFDATYGDPFGEIEKPYDHFDIGAQLNLRNRPHGIGRIELKGALVAKTVSQSDKTQHVLAGYQHFDYIDNEAYVYGGQSFGATFESRFKEEGGIQARAVLHMNAIILGACKSDYFSISGREYDYGPGLGFKFEAAFDRKGKNILTLGHESHFIHSVNGNQVDSYVNFTHVRAHVPIKSFFGAGVEYLLFTSERFYETLPDVSQRSPELRVYAGWER